VLVILVYFYVHSGAFAPGSPNPDPLATISAAMFRFLLLTFAGMLGACSSVTAVRQPLAIEQSRTADKDARKALRNGELLQAQHDFATALALQQSLDDTTGSATTMINLATVAHQLDDDRAALKWLNSIVLEKETIYPQEARLAAAFRKAVILTDLAQLDDAGKALRFADKLCDKKCTLNYGIDALRARFLLLNGDTRGALELAQALGNQDGADKAEQANALRIVATAEEKLQRPAGALQHYQAALEMDKALALSERIGEDLSGMARASVQLGRDQEAAEYSRRAVLVNESRRQNDPVN
jgi:tetratricopeptide (TPR) repeat protein